MSAPWTDLPTDDIGFTEVGDEDGVGFGDDDIVEGVFVQDEEKPTDPKKQEGKPTPHEVRKSGADILAMLWGGAGAMLVSSKTDPPVGRAMQFQAALAGDRFDAVIAHTWIDKLLLQPLVRAEEKGAGLGAVIAMPLLIGVYERNPQAGPLIEQLLRAAVATSFEEIVPIVKKQQAQQRKTAQAMADITELFELPKGVDPIDAVLAAIINGPPTDQTQEPTPDE